MILAAPDLVQSDKGDKAQSTGGISLSAYVCAHAYVMRCCH